MLRVVTFNIRSGLSFDWWHLWWLRRRSTLAAIVALDADVIGLQEAHGFQLRWLLRRLPTYVAGGRGRNANGRGEHCTVLVRRPRAQVAAVTTRWFGDAPERPGTKLPGARVPRIATLAVVEVDGTGRFQFVNTHLDAREPANRRRSVEQLVEWLDPELPTVVVGDLNATPGSVVLDALYAAGLRSAHGDDDGGTYHGFSGSTDGPRIDHVLVDEAWDVVDDRVATGEGGRLPSDHWPVVADLSLRR